MTDPRDTAMRFTPEMYVEHFISIRGIKVADIDVAPIVVMSWSPRVVRMLAEGAGAQPTSNWPWDDQYLSFTGEVAGRRVTFTEAGIGAPATISEMEAMIVCGARTFIGLGWAGSLQPHAPVGTLLIPTTCIREEGTSAHYLDREASVGPDAGLVETLRAAAQAEGLDALAGPHWSTDAPYREPIDTIAVYRQQGVLGVDMETSAMYVLGQFRGVRVCNLLVVSDEVWREWNVAFRTPRLLEATLLAARVVMSALAAVE